MGTAIGILVMLALLFLVIGGLWKTFTKAGEPGWACLIPVYNYIVMLRIAGKPWWYLLLMFIPIVGVIIAIMVTIDLAKNFGKGTGFGLGLAFLGFIFFPILGFGSAVYEGGETYVPERLKKGYRHEPEYEH
jgi:hypothetical protein